MGDLETIKVVIRSLIISSNRPMSVYNLQRDYRENEGHECPFIALGYRNFTAFLQSIPDVVTVLSDGTVRAVTTAETAHIQRLVALQKKPKSRKRSSSYGYAKSSYGSSYSSYGSSYSSYSSSKPPRFYSPPSRPTSSRPSQSYQSSKSYQPSGSYSSSQPAQPAFKRDYYPPPDYTIEKHFEKVREVKDQARLEAQNLALATSEASTSAATSTAVAASTAAVSSTSAAESGWDGKDFMEKWKKQYNNTGVPQSPRMNIRPADLSSDESDDSFYDRFKDEDDKPPEGGRLQSEVRPALEPALDTYFQSSQAINDNVKKKLRVLMKSFPQGLMACVLPEKYEDEFGVSLQWNELGYDSIVQMAHDLRDIIVCKRVEGGDWKLFDASLPLPAENSDETETVQQPVPEGVKLKIYNIVVKYAAGIRAEQLVQLYQESYGKPLALEAPGFDSAEALFLSIQDTVIHLRKIRKECYIYPGQQPPQSQLPPVLKVDANLYVKLGFYPDEVMGPKESFPPLELPPKIGPGEYMELRVAEVYNPHKFWIMLRELSLKLDSLMDELQDFYHEHGDKYVMPNSTIVEGQCCTAKYDGEWHRAIIKSVGEKVEVLYVDYGTLAKVSPTEMRFIHRDFSVLPIQAVRATMSGIQPPCGRQRFTREANHAFLELVAEKHLIGLVQKIDREEPFLELFLIDTTGDTDIHLNDVLVNQNHAAFKPDLLETSESQELCKDSICEQTSAPTTVSCVSPQTNSSSSILTTCVAPSQTTLSAPVQATANANIVGQSQQPPPGFSVPVGQMQYVPPTMDMNAMAAYGLNTGFNPINPTLAAYPASYILPMNAAWLQQQQLQLQQQQQQAFLLAYYQNLYQQSAAALNAQSKMAAAAAAAAAAAVAAGPAENSPWMGAPSIHSQTGFKSQSPPSCSLSPTKSYVTPARNTDRNHNSTLSEISDNPTRRLENETSSRNMFAETASSVSSSAAQRKEPNSKLIVSVSSDTSNDDASIKKKVVRKKRSERRPSAPSVGIPNVLNKLCITSEDEGESTLNLSNFPSDIQGNDCKLKHTVVSESSSPQAIRVSSMLEEVSTSSNSVSDDEVEVDELMTDDISTSTHHNIAPDLVQSVANWNISYQNPPCMTNYWMVREIGDQSLHIFNVDRRAYVSTGELAQKFTKFSTCDSLVQVLKGLDLNILYKIATRQEQLALFSALDGCPAEILKCFDISLNKNGNIVGTFHLTPLFSVPPVLIALNGDLAAVKEFQVLRDSFNPDESFWTQ